MIDPRAHLPSQSLPAARSSTHCSRDQRITGFSTITSKCLPLPSQMETYCRAKALLFSTDSKDLLSAITTDREKHQLMWLDYMYQASMMSWITFSMLPGFVLQVFVRGPDHWSSHMDMIKQDCHTPSMKVEPVMSDTLVQCHMDMIIYDCHTLGIKSNL